MSPRDPLDDLFDRWHPPAGSPPNLLPEIRRQIAAEEISTRTSWWSQLEAAFARPSFAAAFVVACVLLGLFLAETRLTHLHAARSVQMARSYLQLIDPLLDSAAVAAPAAAPSTSREGQ